MTERTELLRTEHLCKNFTIRSPKLTEPAQTLYAVDDVNLSVFQGETLGIIGESGCGKSTLGKCIVRLHNASGGQILYNGADISGARGRALKQMRREIQMVFQDPYSSLDPRKTAGQIVEEPMLIHRTIPSKKEREAEVLSLLQKVGLDIQHVYRYPHEFSGGQRQRLNIARALALHPKIIVCDEPVSALDVSIQAQVLNLMGSLQQQLGLTYVFISHDLGVIKHISDRIAIMYLGKIVELCDVSGIYDNPLHPYTQALLSAAPPESPFVPRRDLRLQGEIPSPIGRRTGCSLATRCPKCMDRCREETPELAEAERGHQVACFLYEGIQKEGTVS